MNEVKSQLERVLRAHLHGIPDTGLDLTDDLRDLGLDSMSVIDVLLDIEATFAITIPDDYFVPETFRTGESLGAVVEGLLGEPSTAS